ncbi:uncharacterized protein BKA55DRAFT_549033 [Fusarium redolens]|uniref:Uncharacterized protein n=1 Tax=Fusarium redolens TaxID=48865 RepID=A0A9P9R8D4_FUSRE|nr:uncharacterized protein BKA55DRAFT_549033 [Fusarium redolens]KAH7269587.1 hypothetical protein BKA55DRAFT_549033 [Fusarium redolens]
MSVQLPKLCTPRKSSHSNTRLTQKNKKNSPARMIQTVNNFRRCNLHISLVVNAVVLPFPFAARIIRGVTCRPTT